MTDVHQQRNGVPESPERSGWHWWAIGINNERHSPSFPVQWFASDGLRDGSWEEFNPNEAPNIPGAKWIYLGPCLWPEEITAREKAAYRQGWNDREGDLLAGIDRVYGTEKHDGK